jgi:AraC-like DNA-binding protein
MIARTSSSTWVRGVVEMFATEGIDVEALFRDARLNIAVLLDPAGRFSIDDVSLLWEMAVARSGNATLGLSRELALTYGKLGCPTLLAALEQLARSMDVVSNAATFALVPQAEGYWFELGHLGGERPVPRQRVEFGMLTMLGFCSWITGRKLQTLAVEFVYPAPEDARPHLEVFECPVHFGRAANRALLRQCDLDLPLSARDPGMAALHARLVEEQLERLEIAPTSHQVRLLLAQRLAQAEPRRKDIAEALNISERTFQRRLQAEGTSFQQLLDQTRRELAQQYLRRRRHSLRHVADLLGFEDQGNLFRACKRWFGESPSTYRARFGVAAEPPRRS